MYVLVMLWDSLSHIANTSQILIHISEAIFLCMAPAAQICSLWSSVFYCIALYTDISFHSQDEYQICQYHQKEQLSEDKVIVIEAQFKKNPLIILKLKKRSHLQYISIGNIWPF